jgi:HemY protein
MKLVFGLIILLIVAVLVGLGVGRDPGYLLIAYHNTTIEAPLWLGIIAILIAYLIFYILLEVLQAGLQLKSLVSAYGLRRKQRAARARTNQGLIELAEGHWAEAEKLLTRGATYADTPLLNYLSAAKAAQEQGADKRRDRYLGLAHQVTAKADVAVGLTQAQLQLNHGQFEQSLATLQHLRKMAPKHPFVLKLLKKIYLQLKDWEKLQYLLPDLRRHKIVNKLELEDLETKIFQQRLLQYETHGKIDQCISLWGNVSKEYHYAPAFVKSYVDILLKHQKHEEAEMILRVALKKQWDEILIEQYGLIRGPVPAKQLAFAEQFLKEHQNHPTLLLALGRLSMNNQLWGKAERYFESSLAIDKRPETYAELGHLLERLGQKEQSAECFRKGLMLKTAMSNASDPDSREDLF